MIRLLPLLLVLGLAAPAATLAQSGPANSQVPQPAETTLPDHVEFDGDSLWREFLVSAVRLPIAALLGTALALRPRRRGTPPRQPPVIQTQIILAVVGALIMLVVGASLARAFGIVGAANLIRYRSKIDDPKDAVVMLCALAVGLASGVGLFGLAVFGTVFLVGALWIIEGFEPQTRVWELTVKMGENTPRFRPRIEAVLRRFKAEYELRGQSEGEVRYVVVTPLDLNTDRVSGALAGLAGTGQCAVEWQERPKTAK